MAAQCCTSRIFAFEGAWYLCLTRCFSVISKNISMNHTLLKSRFFWLHFCRRQYGSIFNHIDVIGPKATEFGEITQNNDHYAVQGHSRSRSLISFPINGPYATCYVWIYLISCTVSEIWRITCQIFGVYKRVPLFSALVWGEPLNSRLRKLASRS